MSLNIKSDKEEEAERLQLVRALRRAALAGIPETHPLYPVALGRLSAGSLMLLKRRITVDDFLQLAEKLNGGVRDYDAMIECYGP
jgi:hypothetical protein